MKKICCLTILCCITSTVFCQPNNISIIPEPVVLSQKSGTYLLPKNITISAANNAEVKYAADYLGSKLSKATGYTVTITERATTASVELLLNKSADNSLGKEGYKLSVTGKNIIINANQPAGLFYGVQTLLQLLPKEIESKTVAKNIKWSMPCVEITDYPRFGWRGLMLDVSRHFFTKEEVKNFIDEMSRYKFNLFHWHLVDDEGWRIEIKRLPKLTGVGAWNVKRVGHFGDFKDIRDDEPRNNGGFYTQEDIKEVVQYAKERFVNVLPEIDVPGHSMAAIASYPELSCTEGADKYKVISGEKFIEWPEKGHFYGLLDNTLCPANEKVYPFLDMVFTELSQLFPFEYIHVGGDECAQNFWEKSDAIKALMQKENLKTMLEVQGYFENKLERIINSKGKKMIGWDEILESGVSSSAAIMSWRGTKGGIEASNKGHEVVMSPSTYVYLDYMQSDEIMEPKIYASLRLNKTYSYEPVSEGINEKLVKGIQGNLWTEQIYNYRQVQYMAWPRAFAVSEIAWSPSAKKNWTSFVGKVEDHFKRFDAGEIKYAPSMYDPEFKVVKNDKAELTVSLSTELDGLDIYYSFDNSYPDLFYPKYTGPVTVPVDATLMRVITYRDKQPLGRINNMQVAELKKRAEKK
ncbi:MAG: family 20 glycosylhydrolase [Chitinophagaceae bacterium]|nr:family 20 glycosylhydrolase [Chitinophagaceae bacterium]